MVSFVVVQRPKRNDVHGWWTFVTADQIQVVRIKLNNTLITTPANAKPSDTIRRSRIRLF